VNQVDLHNDCVLKVPWDIACLLIRKTWDNSLQQWKETEVRYITQNLSLHKDSTFHVMKWNTWNIHHHASAHTPFAHLEMRHIICVEKYVCEKLFLYLLSPMHDRSSDFSRKWTSSGHEGIISAVKMVVCLLLLPSLMFACLSCYCWLQEIKIMLCKWYQGAQVSYELPWKMSSWFRRQHGDSHTIGFWQWWCFMSIFFFISRKQAKKIYPHQKCLTDTCNFNSYLSEILG